MKNRIKSTALFVTLLITACGNNLVQPTQTPTSTPSPIPTATNTSTNTPTPIPPTPAEEMESVIAPRWMLLNQPYYSVEIFGETWNYSRDNWGETYACIDYTREGSDNMFIEQCFAVSQEEQNFESILGPFVDDGFEELTPKSTFEGVEKNSLVAKAEEENNKHYFEIIESKGYILLVEMTFNSQENASLQTIYDNNAADIIDYVLHDSLLKSHLIASPPATPIPHAQQKFYNTAAPLLITHARANALYYGTWEILGDHASTKSDQVCRNFEDRTNADVLWVGFTNCVFSIKDFPFEEIAQYYQQPGDVELTTAHKYEGQFVLYAYQSGHTYFDAFLQSGDYLFLVRLESRTMMGQTPEAVFSEHVDDFIHDVLIVNTGE